MPQLHWTWLKKRREAKVKQPTSQYPSSYRSHQNIYRPSDVLYMVNQKGIS
uniref:Uncharacterized protein n=1 Tax=Oryza brachyantha TaxID=4533 RepID=J3M475_ORYBR